MKPANVRVPTISITTANIPKGKLGRPRGSKSTPKENVENKDGASIQPIKQKEGKDDNLTVKEVEMIADEVAREVETPNNYQEAMKSTYAEDLPKDCEDEMNLIKELKVYQLVDTPKKIKTLTQDGF